MGADGFALSPQNGAVGYGVGGVVSSSRLPMRGISVVIFKRLPECSGSASSTSGSVPSGRSNRRNLRIHHSLATRTGSHVRIHRTYNPARPSLRQP